MVVSLWTITTFDAHTTADEGKESAKAEPRDTHFRVSTKKLIYLMEDLCTIETYRVHDTEVCRILCVSKDFY